jgi:beta-glucanase (GH16 family)
MRSVYLITAIFFIASLRSQIICSGKKVILTENGICNTAPYNLVFEDNFEGNYLDTSKWFPSSGVMRDVAHNDTKQWFTSEEIIVEDGILKLKADKKSLTNQCYSIWIQNSNQFYCEDFDYIAGEIRTKEKFGHGKFEISCKLPKGKGLGMAFWMYGYTNQNEIDVFEFNSENNAFGKPDESKFSRIHRMNSRTDYEDDGHIEDCPTKYKGPDYSEAFHTFTVIWTSNKIEWYVDGQLKRISTLFYTMDGKMIDCNGLKEEDELVLNRAFPLHPMEVYLSMGVFSKKNAPDDSTPFPASFEIDYFRYYRQ